MKQGLFTLLLLLHGALQAASIHINNLDAPREGFNDPTPVEPIGGNPKTTLGEQRLYAFRAALEAWGEKLQTTVPIVVDAEMNPLECDSQSAVLGSAGTPRIYRDFPHAPKSHTWYHSALANSLAGYDLEPNQVEINTVFNSDLDNNNNCMRGVNWYYGIDQNPPTNHVDFYTVVLHEIAHGLGFTTFVDLESGTEPNGYPDIFETFLEDHSSGLLWPEMSAAERANSARNSGQLHWVGPQVASISQMLEQGRDGQHVRMHAPSKLDTGSSVSHWDPSLYPDALMEPYYLRNASRSLSEYLLRDLGWQLTDSNPPPTSPPQAPNVYCLEQPQSIPDNHPGGLRQTLNIQHAAYLHNIAVSIELEHGMLDDLRISLEHNGREVLLFNPALWTKKCQGQDLDAVFWSDAEQSSEQACQAETSPALTGILLPQESLRTFDGEWLNGDWTLFVQDRAYGDQGRIRKWCILPLSQGQCDGDNIQLDITQIDPEEQLVCNAGHLVSPNLSIRARGRLDIYYSGSVRFQELHVERGGVLRLRQQSPSP